MGTLLSPSGHLRHDIMIGNPHHLRRVFANEFKAADIASPLISFDAGMDSGEAARIMERERTGIAGVRAEGRMHGYIVLAGLGTGTVGELMHPFTPAILVTDDTPLPQLIMKLNEQEQLFVSSYNTVVAVITRTEIEKPPVRMWLFGMITLIEMALHHAIALRFPDGSWTELLSPGRLAKAVQLAEERKQMGQEAELLNCLQLSDVFAIFMKDPQLRALAKPASRSQRELAARQLGQLRDHLAHAQPIVQHNWQTIAGLSEVLDRTLDHLAGTLPD